MLVSQDCVETNYCKGSCSFCIVNVCLPGHPAVEGRTQVFDSASPGDLLPVDLQLSSGHLESFVEAYCLDFSRINSYFLVGHPISDDVIEGAL